MIVLYKGATNSGFTIVELLVVIVVIGILAAITIVSYTGISQRAIVSSLQSDLTNAANQLKLDQVTNSNYPATLALANGGKGIPASAGTTYTYAVNNNTTPQIFCLSAINGSYSYNVTQDGQLLANVCPVLNLDASSPNSYPGTGTNWVDLSGSGNNGTLNGGVSYSSANGGALSFDGTSGYVNVANTAVFNSSTFSVGFWMNPSTLPLANSVNPISHGYTGMYWFELRNSGAMDFYIKNLSGSFVNVATGSGYISANVWYYVVGTFDGTTMKYYINNNLINSNNTGGITTDTNNIWVGTGKGATTGGYFNGLINNVRVYSTVLSADDVSKNFNSFRGRYGI